MNTTTAVLVAAGTADTHILMVSEKKRKEKSDILVATGT
jgi:hypothetical protein